MESTAPTADEMSGAPALQMPELPYLPPPIGSVPAGTQWSPMFAAMLPMALAMAQAQTESLGAGPELPVSELFSLGPEAKNPPPSSVPLWSRVPADPSVISHQFFDL